MKIAVTAETRHSENRVAIVPKIAKSIIKLGINLIVETNAGVKSGFTDTDYINSGAEIAYDKVQLYADVDIVLWVKRPHNDIQELAYIAANTLIITFFDPFKVGLHQEYFAQHGVTTLALELLPHNVNTVQMDAFAVMGRFAGKIAYQNAIQKFANNTKLNVLVIGSGNVGMAVANMVCKDKHQLMVVSTNSRFQIEIEQNLAAKFVLLEHLLSDQQQQLETLIADFKPDIVITTARRYGEHAPQIITQKAISMMKSGAIIKDLTANAGGNTEFTCADQVVTMPNQVQICHKSNYPSQQPQQASSEYAQCLYHIIQHIQNIPNYDVIDDNLLGSTVVTHQGELLFKSQQ